MTCAAQACVLSLQISGSIAGGGKVSMPGQSFRWSLSDSSRDTHPRSRCLVFIRKKNGEVRCVPQATNEQNQGSSADRRKTIHFHSAFPSSLTLEEMYHEMIGSPREFRCTQRLLLLEEQLWIMQGLTGQGGMVLN